MGAYVASELVKKMIQADVPLSGSRVLMMGLAFKENCPDLRNTRVVDIVSELEQYGVHVDVYDPWVDADEARREYGITPVASPDSEAYSGIVLAVGHNEFRALGAEGVRAFGIPDAHVLYDLKSILAQDDSDLRL